MECKDTSTLCRGVDLGVLTLKLEVGFALFSTILGTL